MILSIGNIITVLFVILSEGTSDVPERRIFHECGILKQVERSFGHFVPSG